jgi:hypothetical protein
MSGNGNYLCKSFGRALDAHIFKCFICNKITQIAVGEFNEGKEAIADQLDVYCDALAYFKNLCYKIVRNALTPIVKLLEENVEPNKICVTVKMCDGAQRDSPHIPFIISTDINIFSSEPGPSTSCDISCVSGTHRLISCQSNGLHLFIVCLPFHCIGLFSKQQFIFLDDSQFMNAADCKRFIDDRSNGTRAPNCGYSPHWNLWLKSAPGRAPCAPRHLVDTDREKTRLSEGAKGRKRAQRGARGRTTARAQRGARGCTTAEGAPWRAFSHSFQRGM